MLEIDPENARYHSTLAELLLINHDPQSLTQGRLCFNMVGPNPQCFATVNHGLVDLSLLDQRTA